MPLTAIVAAGMAVIAYDNRRDFLCIYRQHLATLDPMPTVQAVEIVSFPPTDFSTLPFSQCASLRFMEGISLQRLRSGNKVCGWGDLLFNLAPLRTAVDRWGPDSTTSSFANQWYQLISQEFYAGAIPNVRTATIAESACQLLLRAQVWKCCLTYDASSVAREINLTRFLALGAISDARRAPAFSFKFAEIVKHYEDATEYRLIMGKTTDAVTLYGYHRQLAKIFAPSEEAHSLVCVRSVCQAISSRLDFMLVEGYSETDAVIIRHVITAWSIGMRKDVAVSSSVGANVSAPATHISNDKLDVLILSKLFSEFKADIRTVLAQPGVKPSYVRIRCFQWCIPWVSQYIIGKRQCNADKIFIELSPHRCTWGSDGNWELEIGKEIGQCMARGDVSDGVSLHPSFSLAPRKINTIGNQSAPGKHGGKKEDSIAAYFVNGRTAQLNMENKLLSVFNRFKSTVADEVVADSDRFLDHMLLDRLREEVGPIFEYFGLGGLSGADSFASIMSEAKRQLKKIYGLSEDDRHDLLRGADIGLQDYVIGALEGGDRTLRLIFHSNDPTVVVTKGLLLQPGFDKQYDRKLADARTVIEARHREQRILPSARARLLASGGTPSNDLSEVRRGMAALQNRTASLEGSCPSDRMLVLTLLGGS